MSKKFSDLLERYLDLRDEPEIKVEDYGHDYACKANSERSSEMQGLLHQMNWLIEEVKK